MAGRGTAIHLLPMASEEEVLIPASTLRTRRLLNLAATFVMTTRTLGGTNTSHRWRDNRKNRTNLGFDVSVSTQL